MRNWNKAALRRTLGRAWGKTPVKKLTALAVMIVITVSSVTTVMAATRKVTVYYNGETYTGSLTGSLETIQDTRAQLISMGLSVDEADRISVASNNTTGELAIHLTSAHTVTVVADGMAKSTVVYEGQTIADALQACGVTVDSNDKLTAPTTKQVSADMVIEVTRRHAVKFTADGETKNLLVEDTTVSALLAEQGITLGKDDVVTPDLSTKITADTDVTVQRVKYEEVTAEEAIPFTETVTNDSSLPRGVTRVDVQGQDGVQKVTRRNKIVDGVVTESTVLSSTVLKEAVNQVSRVGTKDPNGYATIESDGTVYDQNGNLVNYTKLLTGKCSAYTGGGITATGAPAAFGRVAVNPNVIPYGTKLFICSPDGKVVYGYAVASDTGGACMRNTIIADLYYDTLSECYQIGVRNMNVYILG
ncbi:MAG TPA: G5 domain-containing protein [Candidatus Caccousia avicola]|uniref:G5 domain-containing protein n=1 Tax=Candidatus Caccousia avicola TaxID=2840721 RepID=A0A9D1DEA4_9FIRM|nr:G5 domain-containing protein [Candidatus Caccousia avicola]